MSPAGSERSATRRRFDRSVLSRFPINVAKVIPNTEKYSFALWYIHSANSWFPVWHPLDNVGCFVKSIYPHQMSGGRLQRAMTARALCASPHVIVFDEPTTALDAATRDPYTKRLLNVSMLAREPNAAVPDVRPALVVEATSARYRDGAQVLSDVSF
ncbi:ATP-binding cassette domain-containing protein [Paraburkholderia dipogonis]|uniref:ATP-binding cassette domain-containing protein n=1 Tax=Paraburkholderia dipogonis TaxID=1211383 RepID=A0A4Y8MKK4_9BURK|nr:ATP-binding cassette domain-containing protein [Paraburkholderia dipogonis]